MHASAGWLRVEPIHECAAMNATNDDEEERRRDDETTSPDEPRLSRSPQHFFWAIAIAIFFTSSALLL